MTRRTERIGNLIQRELGDFLFREISDQRMGFVTISRVDVTTDLAHAKVYVSIIGTDKEKRDSLAALAHSAGYMRSHLAKILETRTVPRLAFVEDKNLDHGFRIEAVIRDLHANDKPAPVKKDAEVVSDDGENDAATDADTDTKAT
jgi:ribosome-binding factor A